MRKVKRWRYYCDHCGKGGCSAGHMRKHESGCVQNPDRVCRMCEYATGEKDQQQPLESLIHVLHTGGIGELRKAANGCPICMLAGIVHWRKRHNIDRNSEEGWFPEFDFKKERDAMWREHNDHRATVARGGEW